MLTAASAGSGVDTSDMLKYYATAASYSQVKGFANNSGRTDAYDLPRAYANGSIAIGSNTLVTGDAGVALGTQSYAVADDSVALGAGSIAGEANTVSVGTDGTQSFYISRIDDNQNYTTLFHPQANTRRIVNMAAGQKDTDAVNVSQIKGVTTALGGGAGVNEDGSIQAPSYGVAGDTYSDVGSALQAVDEASQAGLAEAVKYDSTAHDKVTFGGAGTTHGPVQLSNVANARQDNDAVNLWQLKSAGLTVDSSGNLTNAFVAYDDRSKTSVWFGGVGSGTPPVVLRNVAAGTVSASSTDAVNGAQLHDLAASTASALGGETKVNADGTLSAPSYEFGTGKTYGDVGSALEGLAELAKGGTADAVVYDSSDHDKLTLGGRRSTVPVQLTNVAKATEASDAVNLGQLQDAGLDVDASGNVKNSFVAYDDEKKDSVTFGGKNPNAQVALHNVAAGAQDLDAVNVSQLKAAGLDVDASGNVKNSFVAYDDEKKDSVTLGGKNPNAPVALHNVAKATNAGDAVNLGQLQEAGLDVDASGNVKNSFVAYDDEKKDSVTFGGKNPNAQVALHNVAAGAQDLDAVNVSQLKAAGLDVDASGNVKNSFVAYDDEKKDSVTLGGKNPNAPVALHNVAKATNAGDAVNLGQLQEAGLDVDASGNVKNSFVAYDDEKKDSVTFGGKNPNAQVALHNVAAGAQDLDAVNVSQLKAAGLNLDPSGNVTNSFVAYDDSTKSQVSLGGLGGTVIRNVKAGSVTATSTDAVNGSQLYALEQQMNSSGLGLVMQDSNTGTITVGANTNGNLVDFTGKAGARRLTGVEGGSVSASSSDAVNGAQLYGTAQSTASALGGGSTVNSDGTISAPSYTAGGTTVNNVGAAIENLDGRVTDLQKGVESAANAVQYDSTAHDQVTLGGTATDTPTVKLTNLTDADLSASSTDAVTGSQLYTTNQKLADLGQAIENVGNTGSQYFSANSSNAAAAATGSNSIAAGGGAIASGPNSTAIGDTASASAANSTAIGNTANASGSNSVALGANSVADRDNTVSVGAAGSERQITNVANGQAPTDAVNMRQLQSVQSSMTSLQRGAYGGVAAATALTMIPDVDAGKTIAVGIGTANYKGYQATALGASARVTQNLKVKVGAGYSAGNTTVGGGMSYQW